MRRFACLLAAFLWLAPAGLRLALPDSEAGALRCAIACGHAAVAGAVCCPMAESSAAGGAGGATLAACPAGDSPGAVPTLPAQPPAILASLDRLAAPCGDARAIPLSAANPLQRSARPPDHVPLLLS